MKIKIFIMSAVLALPSIIYGASQPHDKDSPSAPVVQSREQAENGRIQGEQRFRANCGRCHAAPQKFPPRMMATIVRHMRVRATITEDDMRLILGYMTQ